jgi:hypothetical protein
MKKLASDKRSSLFFPTKRKKSFKVPTPGKKHFPRGKKEAPLPRMDTKERERKKGKKDLLNVNKRIKLDSLRRQERR